VPPPATTISCLCAAVSHILLQMFLRLPSLLALVSRQHCVRLPPVAPRRPLLAGLPPPLPRPQSAADSMGFPRCRRVRSPILRRRHPLRPRSRHCAPQRQGVLGRLYLERWRRALPRFGDASPTAATATSSSATRAAGPSSDGSIHWLLFNGVCQL